MAGMSKLLVLLCTPFPRLRPRLSFLRPARLCHSPLIPVPTALGPPCHFSPTFSHGRYGSPSNLVRMMQTQANASMDCGEPPDTVHKLSFHPWPEWSEMVHHVTAGGYADRWTPFAEGEDDDSFSVSLELPEDFRRLAGACLLYARERPNLLRSLSKWNIRVLVEHGSPFLFKNGFNSVRRIKTFLGGNGSEVPESEKACTVDVMRYVLSYAAKSTSTGDESKSRELFESSVRNLLHELVTFDGEDIQEPIDAEPTAWRDSLGLEQSPGPLCQTDAKPTAVHGSLGYEQSNSELTAWDNSEGHEQSPGPMRQNIEMKRGDWICHKCNFMNFARNTKCLECNEARPKRQLNAGEWECPQCDFFNYGRNMTCLRCDCKRPSQNSSIRPSIGQLLNSGSADRIEIERRLAENDEKAERWFSKVSQLDDSTDLSSAIADEDFPEIMPLRKGTNRFVVSTRKTPLERRLANAQHRSTIGCGGNGGSYTGKDFPERNRPNKMSEAEISQTLDRILGHSTAASGTTKDAGKHSLNSPTKESTLSQGSQRASEHLNSPNINNLAACEKATNQTAMRSNGSAQLPGVSNIQNGNPDNGFPSTMPRHGENQFLNSDRGDHTLTLPHYKRRIAMDQTNNPNFVPFVPFPPDYFAKKNQKPEGGPSTAMSATENCSSATVGLGDGRSIPQGVENRRVYAHSGGASNIGQGSNWNGGFSRSGLDTCQTNFTWNNKPVSGAFAAGDTSNGMVDSGNLNPQPTINSQGSAEYQNHGFPGKSLEGSAITGTDPLDMSEEAKAQRWFRRVAQIKDISELSKIPDEDFPEIMPMRKGVNRFVVSKRKTPLERRLTSAQYRKNLPTVSSEPEKDRTRD